MTDDVRRYAYDVDAIAARPAVSAAAVAEARAEALAPLNRAGGENPYTVHAEVQQTMSDLVGIIRREEEIKTALAELDKLRERAGKVSAPGGSVYNPGWHLALDLRNMLLIAECVAQAALERQESRGGHTRDDYPAMSPEWRKVNLICSLDGGGRVVQAGRGRSDPGCSAGGGGGVRRAAARCHAGDRRDQPGQGHRGSGACGTAGPAARRAARPLTSRRPDACQRSVVTAAGTPAPPASGGRPRLCCEIC